MTVSTPTSLLFSLIPGEETWTIVGPLPDLPPRVVPNPLADAHFRGLVASLREWASRPVPLDRPDPLATEAFLRGLARRVSQRLTEALLADEDRRAAAAVLAENGRVRLVLRVRPAAEGPGSAADAALALPWELLAPEEPGLWPVQDGRLAVIREAVVDGAPGLPEPAGPLTVAATIVAPEDRVAFAYEQEAFRLLAALSPLGQRAVFSDLGGLDDLVELVAAIRATAIHFRGHGLPGGLLFENTLGFAEEVPVGELRRRLATILLNPRRAGSFPGLFFLAAPFTARKVLPGQGPAASAFDEETSSAAALHRSGFAQVVGYFGPVSADLTTRLEERFYESLAQGGSTLAAAELARSALDEPLGAAGARVVYPFGWTQLAVYHRGPDRPLALPGRGARLPARFRRRIVQVHGLPVLERGFIGRRDLLHEIRRRVHQGRRLLVLQGLGGLGKTALASHLLARLFEVRPADRLILRCQEAEGAADPVLVLRGQAEDHGRLHQFRFWDERMKDLRVRFPDPVEGFVEVVRALRHDRPHLAIYADNAESLQEGPKTEESRALGTWRPGAEAWWRALEQLATEGEGLILLTTRYLWSDLGDRAWVGIGSMGLADSLRMIDSFPALARLPREVRTRIAERVDGHPRTVEYLDRLVAWQRRKLGRKRLCDPWRELIEPVLPEQAEQITADLLLEEIWRRLSEGAKEHAKRIGVLRVPAPQFVIDRLGEARDELIRAGLLTRYKIRASVSKETKSFQRWGVHSIVRDFVGQKTDSDSLPKGSEVAGSAYEAWVQEGEPLWSDAGEAIHHLYRNREGDRAWPIVQDYALALRAKARYAEVAQLLEHCEEAGTSGPRLAMGLALLAEARMYCGKTGLDVRRLLRKASDQHTSEEARLLILHVSGQLLQREGHFTEAERFFRQALQLAESPNSVEGAQVGLLYALASILESLGRYAEAEDVLHRAIAILEQHPDDPDLAMSLHLLAGVQARQGRYPEAESTLRRMLPLLERTLGASHPNYGMSLHALGGVLERQGKLTEAEDLLRRALEVKGRTQGEGHVSFAESLQALAVILLQQNRIDEARSFLERALRIKEKVLKEDHPENVATLLQLAIVLQRQGCDAEAGKLLRRSLVILKNDQGSDHPLYGAILHEVASLALRQGSYPQAESLLRGAIEAKERALGEPHPDLVVSLDGLASVLMAQQRPVEAVEPFRRSLAIKEHLVGPNHPSLAGPLHEFGRLLETCENYSEAEVVLQRALEIIERAAGPSNPALIPVLTNLGEVAAAQGRAEEGDRFLKKALGIASAAQGPRGELAARVLLRLAQLQHAFGKPEAGATAQEALAILTEALGAEHPTTCAAALILQDMQEISAQVPDRD